MDIDKSFVVNKDIRLHTGGFVAMITVGAYFQYIKQKLNSKSSTEAEIFGLDDFLTQVVSTWYFLKEQGCEIHDNVIYQDNQIAIKL